MRGICGVAGLRGKSVRGGVARGSRGVRVVFAGPAYTGDGGVARGSRGICGECVVFAGGRPNVPVIIITPPPEVVLRGGLLGQGLGPGWQ